MKNILFLFTLLTLTLSTFAQSTPEQYIIKESIHGKLDFNKVLEKEDNKLFLFHKVAYAKNDFAIVLWAKAVKQIGISSRKKAMILWEQIYKRELKKHEKRAFKNGFKN